MSENYTAGNWTLLKDKPQDISRIDYLIVTREGGPGSKNIARVINHIAISEEEHLANAKLLKAAPDMIEAIKYYFRVLDEARGKDWREKPMDHVTQEFFNSYKKATE